MSENTAGDQAADEQRPSIAFDYIKSREFRVIKVNGAIGGLTPRGDFVMNLWNERAPIPQRTVNQLIEVPSGLTIGDEIVESRVIRDALVREVEVCCMMDIQTAKTLHTWLTNHIEQVDSSIERVDDAPEGGGK